MKKQIKIKKGFIAIQTVQTNEQKTGLVRQHEVQMHYGKVVYSQTEHLPVDEIVCYEPSMADPIIIEGKELLYLSDQGVKFYGFEL
jgi:hypothetical protein